MSDKPAKNFRMLPFQKATVRPITDPVEQAALAESAKRSRVLVSIADMEDVLDRKPTIPAVLEWCRHLSAEDKFAFVTELMTELSAQQRIELKERWAMDDEPTIPDSEAPAGELLTNGVTKKDSSAAASLPLPVALRNEDISEEDFEALCRIADNPEAATGRLHRAPRKIPPMKNFRMPPLQKLTVTPIVDPVERVALRQSVKRSKRAASIFRAEDGTPCEPTLLSMLEWCRQLSAEERLAFATELVAQLSGEQRIELKERLTTQLAGMGG